MPDSSIKAALEYRARGFWVIPNSGKAPVLQDWPNLRLDEEAIGEAFGPGRNVGVILGASGLADLDFDDPAAVNAYQALAPEELAGAAVFEHAGRPHLIIKSKGIETKRYKRADGSVLLELRGEGAQTVFPPSIHPDGLPYVWVKDCEPCEVDAHRLQKMAAEIATTAYASEFWTQGSRHELALALSGFLARRLTEQEVLDVITAVATVAMDAEFPDRRAAVESTIRRVYSGEPVVGLPTLDTLASELARALSSWWDTPTDNREDKVAAKPKNPSQADGLVEMGREAELFHDPIGMAFGAIQMQDHKEIWPLASKTFKNWLRRAYYLQFGKAPGSDALNAACGVLDGIACFDGSLQEVHNRVARFEGAIYYDLADSRWRTIRITREGWKVIADPPVRFRRYAHQRFQVEPVAGGDVSGALRFLNVRPEDRLLLLAWLVAAFIPDIPHPIPDFHGEKGSGKSVGQRALRRLIDPSGIESLAFPGDVRELVQQLAHHYCPIYDNVDALPPWISDILCRAVTGEGFSKRELYSDDDDIIYSYRRVLMLNGVNVVARRADILDRSILMGLERITRNARREESEFWAAFEEARPHILGGIFDTLAVAMRIYPALGVPSLERMADFTRWGAAISEALGYGARAFLDAYSSNIGIQSSEAVEGHVVGAAVLALMKGRGEWSGTPAELLGALEEAGETARLFRRALNGKVDAKGWPGAPHILTRRLNEIRSNLTDLGLEIIEGRGDERVIMIRNGAPKDRENTVGSDGSDGSKLSKSALADATDDTVAKIGKPEGGIWEVVVK